MKIKKKHKKYVTIAIVLLVAIMLYGKPLGGLKEIGHYPIGYDVPITASVFGETPYDEDYSDGEVTQYYWQRTVFYNGDKIDDSGLQPLKTNSYNDDWSVTTQDGSYVYTLVLIKTSNTFSDQDYIESGQGWGEWDVDEADRDIQTFTSGTPAPPPTPFTGIIDYIQSLIRQLLDLLGVF